MATHAPITGAPTRAPSNITRLPGAALRKVQQPTPRRCAKAIEAGAAVRLPVDHRTPVHRMLVEDAELIAALQRTPELLLVMAMLNTADEKTKASVLGACIGAKLRLPDCGATRQALAVSRKICSDSPAMWRS